MNKSNNKKLCKYDYYKTQFIALSITIALGYIYSSLYNSGLFGEKAISLNILLSGFINEGLSDIWFYISLLPIVLLVIVQVKKGEFQRIQFYNPYMSKKITYYVVLSVVAIVVITLLTASHLFSLVTLLGSIMISYSVLFTVSRKLFTIQNKIEEIQRMRIEDL